MTRSAKKLDLAELLQKYLKILYRWPLVEQDRNVKKSSRILGRHGHAQIVSYNTTISRSKACDVLDYIYWAVSSVQRMTDK